MPFYITQECTACGDCVDMCPIEAIRVDDPIYVIEPECTDFMECLAFCEVDAIQPIPEMSEESASTVTLAANG
ncbi:MAG: 4Fe-4S binding protein [Bacteroidota bacterium]|nr:4Fe-4S binding protein [Bacteroidota bacterium]